MEIKFKKAKVVDKDGRLVVYIDYEDTYLHNPDILEDGVILINEAGVMELEAKEVKFFCNSPLFGPSYDMDELREIGDKYGGLKFKEDCIIEQKRRLFSAAKSYYKGYWIEFVNRKPYKRICSNYQIVLDDQTIEK